MSDTTIHKLEAKYYNKLIEYKNIPIRVRKKWSRRNCDIGYFRRLKLLKIKRILDKDLNDQLTNTD